MINSERDVNELEIKTKIQQIVLILGIMKL